MIVNTKTGGVKLTKRERDTLQGALNILAQLEKHGSASESQLADDASTHLGQLLENLTPEEAVTA